MDEFAVTTRDFGLITRVVRFHNIFGPLGTYDGGREKSPAAICRKAAVANDGDEIEVLETGGSGVLTVTSTIALRGFSG